MPARYPVFSHILALVPLLVSLAVVRIVIGPEEAVYAYFSGLRADNPSLTPVVAMFSHGALFAFYPVYAWFLLRGLGRKKPEDVFFALAYLVGQLLFAALLCRVVKIAVGRPRPMTGGPFVPFSFGWGYQSFPSGHTGEALGASLPFLWRYGKRGAVGLPLLFGSLVAAVGLSRLYLGMHHPSDVLAGLVFGSLSGYCSWTVFGWLRRNWRRFAPDWLKKRLEA